MAALLSPRFAATQQAPSTSAGSAPASTQPLPANLRNEVPVEGFTRRDPETISLRLPGSPSRELLLHGFFFNSDPVATNKLHLRQLAPNVFEITSLAYSTGEWEFSIADTANIYGTGARSDALNRAHTFVRNAAQSIAGAQGSATARPVPFFMSTTGYGLWLDTPAEATFDFNTARLADIILTASSERLRIVLFTNRLFPGIQEAFATLKPRAAVPPYSLLGPFAGPANDPENKSPAASPGKPAPEPVAAPLLSSGVPNAISFSRENGLPAALLASLNAGLSGLPLWGVSFSSAAPSSPLALARSMELAAFSALMDPPAREGTQTLEAAARTTGERFGAASATELYRRYAALHASLFPYRYAVAREAGRTGMPLVRALPLVVPEDDRARTSTDEYLFGPDLLVAPVTDANTHRPVYLPPGDWVDFWTGAPFAGSQTMLADAPAEAIPVFARRGTVLPEIPEDEAATGSPTDLKALDDRRVYEVVEAGASASVRFEDFEGRLIERSGAKLTIGPPERKAAAPARITVRWRFGKVSAATVDGKPVQLGSDAKGSYINFAAGAGATVVNWR